MAKNEIHREADHLSLPVPAGTKAGTPLRIGILNVIAETNRANTVGVPARNNDGSINPAYDWGGGNPDGNASCSLTGSVTLVVAFAANVGDAVYITPGGALTATASGNQQWGAALSAKAAPSGPLTVRPTN